MQNEKDKARQARSQLNVAVRSGVVQKPVRNVCEHCGKDIDLINHVRRAIGQDSCDSRLVAHHAYGYDDPLNVWWVCPSCNTHLPHDGSNVVCLKQWNWKEDWEIGYRFVSLEIEQARLDWIYAYRVWQHNAFPSLSLELRRMMSMHAQSVCVGREALRQIEKAAKSFTGTRS